MATSFIPIAGKQIEVRTIEGNREKSPIVLLHEGLGSVSMWRDFPDRLAARTGRTVHAYSRFNYGQSDPLGANYEVDYMHREAVETLPQVLEAVHAPSPILLGHSDGASIALIYAGSGLPLAGLVVEAPHMFVEDLSIRSIEAARVAYTSTDLPLRLARHHQNPDAAFWGWNTIWLDPAFRKWDITTCLGRIRCPVLAIQGEQDEYGTMAQLGVIERLVPTQVKSLRFAACGHGPHRDQPEETLAAIDEFVAAIE